jgi:exopolysaccharide biosynthesis polyprenyl glycosylphosphotransferase
MVDSGFWQKLKSKKLRFGSVLFVNDTLALIFAAVTSYNFRFRSSLFETEEQPSIATIDYELIVGCIVLGWLITFGISGIYNLNHDSLFILNLQNLIKRSFIYFFSLGFLSFVTKASFSRTVFVSLIVLGLINLILTRTLLHFIYFRPLIKTKKLITRLMIVGRTKRESQQYSDWIGKNRLLGYAVVSRMECAAFSSGWLDEFERILKFTQVDEILLLPGMESDRNFSRFVHYCEDLAIKTNWIPLDSGNLGYWLIPKPQVGIPFLAFSQSKISVAQRMLKRSFDLLFALFALVLLSPVYLMISVLILINSGRPVFYSQKRVGLNGKVFNFYKFRSMVKDADKLISSAENIHARDHVIFKDKKDPRITPIGRILRKYSLDELPQFFNVLINDMSVVGPRPALVREVRKYDSLYERRLNAKPGVTGPWQISGRSDLDLQTSVALDLNYLVNWSFTRDLWIIIATIGAVFKGRGAY